MIPPRAISVIRAVAMGARVPSDSIELSHDERYRRRINMRSTGGVVFLLDLEQPTRLMHGDGLLLEDGRIIAVLACEEPIAEIVATSQLQLARLAWHIGNRHVAAEILRDRIRIMPDEVIETMAHILGGHVRKIRARFEPEGGAYAGGERYHDAHHHLDEPDH